jgi:glycogen debranching enzyme
MPTQVIRAASRVSSADDTADEIVEIGNRYYVLASSSLAEEDQRILKDGESFAIFDRLGDVRPLGFGEEGIYHRGTRFLSGGLLRVGRERPLFLSSAVTSDNVMVTVDLTNPDISRRGRVAISRGTLHIERRKVLSGPICRERIMIRNFGREAVTAPLSVSFASDYVDLFEVRGVQRARRGRRLAPRIGSQEVTLGYEGLDRVRRRTRIRFDPAPTLLRSDRAEFAIHLNPGTSTVIDVGIACESGVRQLIPGFETTRRRAKREIRVGWSGAAGVASSNERFNAWLRQSLADLEMMTTETPQGPYPYAGIPWFSAPFGRDGIITALQCLWLNPALARGVLGYLAANQADAVDPARDEQPGKVLHEVRSGEMATLGETPFGRYYGSHDATPLFVLLAGEYFRRTADIRYAASLWPHVERALDWMDGDGDPDGDGFLEYQRMAPEGIAQQGWKDSWDSIFHADGEIAPTPIALCEVQAYAFAAKREAAELADALGHAERAAALRNQANELQRRFEAAFWMPDLGTYALALDGEKRPCRVRTSNPGHALFAGIADPGHARRVARSLLGPAFYSGWGIRTVADGEARYNPMSYQNGSVWPHDNALIAVGLARYGFKEDALRVLEGLFDASMQIDLARLPELFCGFRRGDHDAPTLYPVACSPQAWAAGAIFHLLQACLGLEVDARQQQVRLTHARLPRFIDSLHLTGLQVGQAAVDLILVRQELGVGINVVRRTGKVEIIARR